MSYCLKQGAKGAK